MNVKFAITILNFLLFSFALTAQTNGANRYGIDWKVIKTEAANIIFAPEMEAKANRVANIVNFMRENNTLSVGSHEHKIDILIRNETTTPNGYVALGPYRSEFFASPPDRFNRIGATDWIEHLAIHEFRHVMQTANEKVGLTKAAYYLTGQSGWNGLKFLSIPSWVSEGDAVTMETSLTKSGRGRMPYFTRGLRALALEDKDYNYSKWRNGSYDELMPNQYPFGYMLMSYLRNNKGSKVVGDILRRGSSYRDIIYPYSAAMKAKTGWTTTSLYKEAWKHFGDQWREEVKALELTPTKEITKTPRVVTNYYFPQFGKNNQIVALKNSYKETEKLVSVNNQMETPITSIGFSFSDYFNLQNGIFTWTEFNRNGRRNNTQYSNIYIFDSKTNEKRKLTKKGKYFSPALSSDAEKVVAIHIATDLTHTLQILNTRDGRLEAKLPIADGASITRSIFSKDSKSIYYIIKSKNFIWIESKNLFTNETKQLSPKSSHVVDAISCHSDYIYCSASFTGIDNIFRIPTDGSQIIEQITSVPIGAYEPSVSPDGKTLVFTEYTTKGQMISSMELNDSGRSKIIQLTEPIDMEWMDKVSTNEEGGDILTDLPSKQYQKEDYKGFFKGMKLHSWAFNPNSAETVFGLQFNNILDDMSIFTGGGYNFNEERAYYQASMKVARYYPIYNFEAESRGRSSINFTAADTFAIQRYTEHNIKGAVSIPYSWVAGNYFKNIQFGADIIKKNLRSIKINNDALDDQSATTSEVFFQFSTLRRRAYQNVRPRLGISFIGRYAFNLSEISESRFLGTTRFYLPGIDRNHSLLFTTSYQRELAKNKYQLPDNFGYPRGYDAPLSDEVYKLGVDYMFPLAYPDFGILGIVYLRRLRMNLFYDVGKFRYYETNLTDNYQSIGSDLYFDITSFNLIPSSFIIRYSYRLTENIFESTGGEFRFFTVLTF